MVEACCKVKNSVNIFSLYRNCVDGPYNKKCWKEAEVLQIELNNAYRKYKESAIIFCSMSDQSAKLG
jgi:hypothetical protein